LLQGLVRGIVLNPVRAAAGQRVAQLTQHLMRALPKWLLAPVVDSLIALRGIDQLAAIVLLAGLGDIAALSRPKSAWATSGVTVQSPSVNLLSRCGRGLGRGFKWAGD